MGVEEREGAGASEGAEKGKAKLGKEKEEEKRLIDRESRRRLSLKVRGSKVAAVAAAALLSLPIGDPVQAAAIERSRPVIGAGAGGADRKEQRGRSEEKRKKKKKQSEREEHRSTSQGNAAREQPLPRALFTPFSRLRSLFYRHDSMQEVHSWPQTVKEAVEAFEKRPGARTKTSSFFFDQRQSLATEKKYR
jgi:hypothetical protein